MATSLRALEDRRWGSGGILSARVVVDGELAQISLAGFIACSVPRPLAWLECPQGSLERRHLAV
jgi:hypothetical protein